MNFIKLHFQGVISGCGRCSKMEAPTLINGTTDAAKNQEIGSSRTSSQEARLLHRVTELELELAQAKLAQVEAECRNQVNFQSNHVGRN